MVLHWRRCGSCLLYTSPTADMSEIAKGVDDSYSAVQGNFTTKESKDEDKDSGSEAYPDEVLKDVYKRQRLYGKHEISVHGYDQKYRYGCI